MRSFNAFFLTCLLFATSHAFAGSSFRLYSGKLIENGMRKSEVIAIAGKPLSEDIEVNAVDKGEGKTPVKKEVLTYQLKAAIGGLFLVELQVENNTIVNIESQQLNRQ